MELQSSPGAYDDISSRQLVQSSMTERWLRTVVLVPSLKPSITSIIESVLWQLRWLPLEEKQRVTNSDAAKSGRCWLYPEPAENLVRVWSLLLTFKCGTLYTCLLYFPTNRMPLNKGLNSFLPFVFPPLNVWTFAYYCSPVFSSSLVHELITKRCKKLRSNICQLKEPGLVETDAQGHFKWIYKYI